VFTASTRTYADQVLNLIDPQGYVTGRFYREHCTTAKDGTLLKNMDNVTKNLNKLVIIDDSEQVYSKYKGNYFMCLNHRKHDQGRPVDCNPEEGRLAARVQKDTPAVTLLQPERRAEGTSTSNRDAIEVCAVM
jgi:hypothetical protein